MKIGHRYFPDQRCRVCQKKGIMKQAEYLNLNDFIHKRFLCSQCLNGQNYIIPLIAGVPSQFSLNIEINKNSPQQTKKFKQSLTRIFKTEVQKKYINEILGFVSTTLFQWRSQFQAQLQGICGTFSPYTINNFLQLLANDGGNTKKVLESVEAMRFAGCRSLNRTHELLDSVMKSFKNLTELMKEELENTKSRYTVIRSKMSRFKIGKIYDTTINKKSMGHINLYSLQKYMNYQSQIKNIEKNFYKRGVFQETIMEQIQKQDDGQNIYNTHVDYNKESQKRQGFEKIMSSARNNDQNINLNNGKNSNVKLQYNQQNLRIIENDESKNKMKLKQQRFTINQSLIKPNVFSQSNNIKTKEPQINNNNNDQYLINSKNEQVKGIQLKLNPVIPNNIYQINHNIEIQDNDEQDIVICQSFTPKFTNKMKYKTNSNRLNSNNLTNKSKSYQPNYLSSNIISDKNYHNQSLSSMKIPNHPFQYPKTQFTMQQILYVDIYNYRTIWATGSQQFQFKPIPYQKIKCLYIKFDKSHIAEPLKHIHQLINLQQIIIQQPNLCKIQLIKFYITTFNKLKRLQLNCYNQFRPQCIQVIRDNLPNIQILHYGANFHLAIKTINQKKNFRQQPRKKPDIMMNTNQTLFLINSCPRIKDIWIPTIQQQQVLHRLLNLQNLQVLAIGNLFNELLGNTYAQEQFQFSLEAWDSLSRIARLKSLAFLKVQLNPDSLSKIIKNSKGIYMLDSRYKQIQYQGSLQSFCIRQCKKLVDSITDALGTSINHIKENTAVPQ